MLFVSLTLLGCASGGPTPTAGSEPAAETASIRDADVAALKAAGEVVLVDVRTPDEFSGGHVPGATNIPLNELSGRLEELRPHADQEIWLICRSGSRSMSASGILLEAGFRPVNVTGGTLAWQSAGYPVE